MKQSYFFTTSKDIRNGEWEIRQYSLLSRIEVICLSAYKGDKRQFYIRRSA